MDKKRKEYLRGYRKKNKERILKQKKEWYKNNKDKKQQLKWYKNNKDRILKISREKNLKKRFGFIPKIYLHNKKISSDGCFFGNSRVIERYKTPYKMVLLYDLVDYYKIQVITGNEEFWFKMNDTYKNVNEFFIKLKRYAPCYLKLLEREKCHIEEHR